MSIQASASLNVQIPSGPTFAVNWIVSADAYDRATVTVPKGLQAGKPGTTLELQPALPAHAVQLLVFTSSDYSGSVTYNFGGNSWKVTEPQIIAGPGLAGALSFGQTIIFDTSAAAADVTIDVLVLRTALQ
jgi:hypothetical protein